MPKKKRQTFSPEFKQENKGDRSISESIQNSVSGQSKLLRLACRPLRLVKGDWGQVLNSVSGQSKLPCLACRPLKLVIERASKAPQSPQPN